MSSFLPAIKVLHHSLTIVDTTQATSTTSGALQVFGGVGIQGSLAVGGTLYTSGQLAPTATTNSTSPSTGAMTMAGGLGIENTTDATELGNGGAVSIAGGVSIGKKLFIGGDTIARNSLILSTDIDTSAGASIVLGYKNSPSVLSASDLGTWSLLVDQNNALSVINRNTSNLAVPVLTFDETTGSIQLKSKQSATLVRSSPNREDQLEERTFVSSSNVVSSQTNITGLVFNTSRAFICTLVVFINATVPISTMYELRGIKSGSDTWELSVDTLMGDSPVIFFSINTDGQVTFTKTTTAGFVSTTMKWRTKSVFD